LTFLLSRTQRAKRKLACTWRLRTDQYPAASSGVVDLRKICLQIAVEAIELNTVNFSIKSTVMDIYTIFMAFAASI